ncbi:MAG TPA: peptidase M16 [Rhodospirillaceae bacterium]|nr:peptidase M16 [Rhodospirillaceae bacterium]HAA92689.1 peptidase M16 [Rhodospirillaceae bacterium]HAT36728.1 peptidase M16 [Rhodospirillaceae bacterium]
MGVELTRLDNGFSVVTHEMSGVESASVGVWIGSGTRHESHGSNGVAHLLEHMAFKGTERRSAQDIAAEIEAVGGHLNAYTGRESTAYFAKMLAPDVPLAADILADILQNATFEQVELERERQVVLQEIGQAADTPDDIIFDYYQAAAYPDQPMGLPVLGKRENVESMSSETIRDYLSANYSFDRAVFSAAGKVEHEAIVQLAEDLFSDLPGNGASVEKQPARYAGGEKRVEADLEQVHFLLGFEGFPFGDPDFYALSILSTIFGAGMSSRLFQEIREKRGLAYSVYSFAAAYSDSGTFGIYAGTGPDQIDELVPALCEEITGLAASVTDEEVTRARTQLKAGTLMSLESTGGRAEQLGQQTLVYGAPLPLDELVRRIEAVDIGQIRKTAERLFASRPTMTATGALKNLEGYDSVCDRLKL